jgi:hypothetical protein
VTPFVLIAATLSAACGGQVGEEPAVCAVIGRTPLQPGDDTGLGFSVDDALAAASGSWRVPLQWADDRVTEVAIESSFQGGVLELQQRAWRGGGGGELTGACEDVLAVELDLEVATDDAALAGSWTVIAEASEVDAVRLSVGVGDVLDLTPYTPEGAWDEVHAWLDLDLSAAGQPTGAITGQSSRAEADTDTVVARGFDVATIGPR